MYIANNKTPDFYQQQHCNPLQGNYRVELVHREISVVITGNVTFHEQHSIGYGFPSLLLATRASADVLELVFKHEWRSHECLKTIPTHPLRHT